MKKLSKLTALILTICILVCSFPFAAFAQELPEIESVQIDDVCISQNDVSIWSEYDANGNLADNWVHYDYNPSGFVVNLKNGATLYSDGNYVEYQEDYYWLEYNDPQSYENQWGVGEHTVNCSIMGFDTSFKVIVESNHITDIDVHDVTVYDGLNSGTAEYWDEDKYIEYKTYNIPNIHFDITFDDGHTETDVTWCDYMGNDIYPWAFADLQSPDNEWQIGNTYPVYVEIGGYIKTVNVTVAPNPLVSVKFEDTSVIADPNNDRYDYNTTATLTFDDGETVETETQWMYEYNDNWYSFNFEDTQDETPWAEGGTYDVTGTIMGVSANFKVTVNPSPVEKIEISDTFVVEELDGYYSERWIDEYTCEPFFIYNYDLNGKVTYKDGSSQNFSGWSLTYQGEDYNFRTQDQQYESPWTAGNTYKVSATLMGVSTDFDVEVKELSFTALQVDDIVLSESNKRYDDRYDYSPMFKFTCKDGSIYSVKYGYPVTVYGKQYYESYIYDDQYEQPWEAGNTYTLTAKFGKLSADFKVTIATENTCDGYTYISTDDGAIITGCPADIETLTVPTSLNGDKVIGISHLGSAMWSVKELVIPDGIKFVSDNLFSSNSSVPMTSGEEGFPLETVRIGKDVDYFNASMLEYCDSLKNIFVSDDNQEYSDYNGIMLNKSQTSLVWYPLARDKKIVLPSTVDDFSIIYDIDSPYYYEQYYVVFEGESGKYVTVDGVTYSADMTTVISCDKTKSGTYEMPNTVTDIKPSAFANCDNLTGVKVSNNVATITYAAFADCASLKNVELPESVTSIREYAFCECPSLGGIDLPTQMCWLETRAFKNDVELSGITFPTTDFVVDYECFANTGFTQITIPTNGYEWYSAFSDCAKLKTVTLAEGNTHIASSMFSGCTALETVNMPSTIKSIGSNAFYNSNALKSINLVSGITDIYEYAFYNSGLTSVTLPDSVVYMDNGVFEKCKNLKTATIGKGLTELHANIFAETALESIVIPDNIEVIGSRAFFGCSKLSQVEIKNKDAYISAGAFSGCPISDISSLISENATEIAPYSFMNTAATDVVIPETVTNIMYGAFKDSKNLIDITLPSHLESLGRESFNGTAWYNQQPSGLMYMGDNDY
ncbi:MAG: leucine-rich repeat protein, partial [Oscillospiraceae bacterium]|nr:leucine-rich repeat protein [Candidatus Equicaccousia limihippi]